MRRSGLRGCLSVLLCSVSPMGNGERSLLDIGHLFVHQLDQFRSPLSTRLRCIATVHIVRQLSRAQAKKRRETMNRIRLLAIGSMLLIAPAMLAQLTAQTGGPAKGTTQGVGLP